MVLSIFQRAGQLQKQTNKILTQRRTQKMIYENQLFKVFFLSKSLFILWPVSVAVTWCVLTLTRVFFGLYFFSSFHCKVFLVWFCAHTVLNVAPPSFHHQVSPTSKTAPSSHTSLTTCWVWLWVLFWWSHFSPCPGRAVQLVHTSPPSASNPAWCV